RRPIAIVACRTHYRTDQLVSKLVCHCYRDHSELRRVLRPVGSQKCKWRHLWQTFESIRAPNRQKKCAEFWHARMDAYIFGHCGKWLEAMPPNAAITTLTIVK